MHDAPTDAPATHLAAICWITTAILAGYLCLVQIGVMAGLFAAHIGISLVAPVALIAILPLGYWLARRENLPPRIQWYPIALTLIFLALSLAISAFYYDLSWDGQWYHQTAILAIARDWNPSAEPMRSFTANLELWVRHYPKGPWYFAAAIFKTTGNIELGKSINWLALAAMFLATLAASLDAGLTRTRAIAIATLVSLNPVGISELTTFLVDGIMISFLVVCAASLISICLRPRLSVILAGTFSAIVSINAKFNGLVFLLFALAAFALWLLFKRREFFLPFAGISLATILLATCVLGYNPYVTNTLTRQQPFYPVLGSANWPSITGVHIENGETPRNMRGRNRFVRFAYAIFGRPGNQPYRIGKNATLMWPFTARWADLYSYTYHETRVAGFGPFFSGCLILSLVLGIWLLFPGSAHRWLLLLFTATITGSLLISVHLWWARYGPQLWLLPIVPLIFALMTGRSRPQIASAYFVLTLLLINAAIVAAVRMHWETVASRGLARQLQQLHDSGKEYDVSTEDFDDSWKLRLTAAGVRFHDLGPVKIKGQDFISMVEGYPLPVRYREAAK